MAERKAIPATDKAIFVPWWKEKKNVRWWELLYQPPYYTDDPDYIEWLEAGKPEHYGETETDIEKGARWSDIVNANGYPTVAEFSEEWVKANVTADEKFEYVIKDRDPETNVIVEPYWEMVETEAAKAEEEERALVRRPDEDPTEGYEWVYDATNAVWIERPIEPEAEMTPYQKWQTEFAEREAEAAREEEVEPTGMSEYDQWQADYLTGEAERDFAQAQQDYELEKWRLEEQLRLAEQELDSNLAYQEWEMGYIPHEAQQQYELDRWRLEQDFELQRQNLELSQAQLQQEQANYLANLATHPRAWLEHNLAAGTQPVVQPWMKPLSSQEYPGLEGLQVGQPIPGWPTDWSGMEASAPPVYSPVDMGTTPISTPPQYTPFAPSAGQTPTALPATGQPTGTAGYPSLYEPPPGRQVVTAPPAPPEAYTTGQPLTFNAKTGQWVTGAGAPPTSQPVGTPSPTAQPMPTPQPTPVPAPYTGPEEDWKPTGGWVSLDEEYARQKRWLAKLEAKGSAPRVIKAAREVVANYETGLAGGKTMVMSEDVRPGYWSPSYPIQMMQHGGIVNKPTLALLGEKGPEMVTPLSNDWQNWTKPQNTGGGTQKTQREFYQNLPQRGRGTTASQMLGRGGGTSATTSPAYKEQQVMAGESYQNWLIRKGRDDDRLSRHDYQQGVYLVGGGLIPKASFPEVEFPYKTSAGGTTTGGGGGGGTPGGMPPTGGAGYTPPGGGGTPSGGGWPGINDPYYPLGGLPQLTAPSRQYQARMGPTNYQQYQGYMQATTGIRPEELDWRLWNMAPPGGRHPGLTYTR